MILETYPEKAYYDFEPDTVSVTLRNQGGTLGGGGEVIVVERRNESDD